MSFRKLLFSALSKSVQFDFSGSGCYLWQFNPFEPSVASRRETSQNKRLVSVWNATMGWHGLNFLFIQFLTHFFFCLSFSKCNSVNCIKLMFNIVVCPIHALLILREFKRINEFLLLWFSNDFKGNALNIRSEICRRSLRIRSGHSFSVFKDLQTNSRVFIIGDLKYFVCYCKILTLSWRGPLSYRNQSIDLQSKSMDWFLCNNGLGHERVKCIFILLNKQCSYHFAHLYLSCSQHDFFKV